MKGKVTLAAQLSNRDILMINLWDEVYSQDKKDDIDLKLREHDKIICSEHEQKRLA